MADKDHRFSFLDIGRAALYLLDEHKYKTLFWVGVIFLARFYRLVPAIIVAKIVDFFTTYKSGDSLMPFYLYVIFFGVSHMVVAWIRLTGKNKLTDMEAELIYNAKVKGFEQLLDFSLMWHDKENSGNKVQRIQNGIYAFRTFRKLFSNDGLEVPAAFIGIFVVFIFLRPIFVIFLISYTLIFLFIHFYFYRRLKETTDSYNTSLERANGVYYEGLNNVVTLKTLGAKESFKENIYSNEQESKEFMYSRYKVAFRKTKVIQTFNSIAIIVYFFMIGQGIVVHAITVGSIFIFYSYLDRLEEAAWQSIDIFDDLVEVRSAVARMMPIYWEDTGLRVGTKHFPIDWKSISIENGFFHYKRKEQDDDTVFAINNLDFKIEKGEKVGIVGHSGSGKSTLAKVLLGMYDLDKGSFQIGSTNYYDIKHTEITKHIAIVLQESEMFNLSLKDNITLMKTFDPELFHKAITIAQLTDLIQRLPKGIETLIGEKGYRLSGGERQRLGIARAIYKNPEVFVFDEATSSLDTKTEQLIQEALENQLQKKTMIIIAHRVSTLKNVDRIYVFDHGKVVEEGKYDQLISDSNSTFYTVYQQSSTKATL